jgi:hypothetical protein
MQFKLDFAAARREFRLTNQTSQQSDVDAIAQLTTAITSDHGIVAILTVTYARLASQLQESQACIKTMNDEILALKGKIKPA